MSKIESHSPECRVCDDSCFSQAYPKVLDNKSSLSNPLRVGGFRLIVQGLCKLRTKVRLGRTYRGIYRASGRFIQEYNRTFVQASCRVRRAAWGCVAQ